MKKLSFTQGLLFALFFCAASQPLHAVQFVRLSLAEAKVRAAQLQRPLFVNFHANWCLPCQWMDNNTFLDPNVSDYLSLNYLAVKIDVDEVQGYADKEACGVKFLPSMLVFNASGIVVVRYEETLDAGQLLTLLQRYNTPENRVAQRPLVMNVNHISSPVQENIAPNLSADADDDPAKLDAQRRRLNLPTPPPPGSPGIRKLGVQLGVFSSYEQVIQQVQFFEKKFNKPVNISSRLYNGQTYYHLIAGPFDTPAQMQTYLNALQREGLKSLVVLM
ncbi:thioredoxin family protein [Haliscomenobacter hydrossis]|uniref:Sporulation domain-containing protein n=1 Tax=Haliscomenobacter hydrossis (strain ATCC 27775 / DSM 1100 / LMG 10767 / O) TaxID=760192 RepID=F4KPT7_HALH1|nr:thioredoxin family protein [Haliscomenobacter hydrossis]AEE52187.1 Sporulation domain-containing protein [Haliscomenobacter hydrossis DSM 1100]